MEGRRTWLASCLNGFSKPLSLSRLLSLTGVDSGFVWRGLCRRGCAPRNVPQEGKRKGGTHPWERQDVKNP